MEEQKEEIINEGRPYLTIVVNKNNSLQMSGSIKDPELVFRLLGASIEFFGSYFHPKKESTLVKPSHRIMDFLRNGKK